VSKQRPKAKHWILDEEGIPKEVSLQEWAVWFESFDNRVIKQYERDGYLVSTVFLGIDHNWSGKGPPILFETMIFDDQRWGKPGDAGNRCADLGEEMACERYSTKDDALIGHERHVKELDRKLDYASAVAESVDGTFGKE
jgi:hypothetical protein